MGVKNEKSITTDWLFENSIISSPEAISSKDACLLFSLSGVITHIRQELMSALSKRVFVRASDLSYLNQKNLRLAEQSYFLVVKLYSCYTFFDNVANHVFYLFLLKNDILYKSDRIYQKN